MYKRQKVNTFIMNNIKLSMFLDLINAGYENAYVSIIDFRSQRNNQYNRIEIFLPNVGRLCLYQNFIDVYDVQIPQIKIFYTVSSNPNIITRITNPEILNRASHIIYNCKKYFDAHPEYAGDEKILRQRIQINEKIAEKQYLKQNAVRRGFLSSLFLQK